MDTGQVYLDIYSLYLEVRRKKEDQGAQDEAGGRLRVKYTLGYLERALVVPFDVDDLLVGVICATTVSAKMSTCSCWANLVRAEEVQQ